MTHPTSLAGPARYFAVDLEMTGLDEDAHLLEIGVLILDPSLREIASYTSLVRTPSDVLDGMNPVVERMHATSGLLEELRRSTHLPTAVEVEREVLQLLDEHQDPTVPMHFAGGGVAQFDQPMLNRMMPALAARLHYRPLDFSIIRQGYKDANGVELAVPNYEHPHRAEIDLRNDVQVGRIIFDMLRAGHRVITGTAPVIPTDAREQAEHLLETSLCSGQTPGVPNPTPELVEALLDVVRQRIKPPHPASSPSPRP